MEDKGVERVLRAQLIVDTWEEQHSVLWSKLSDPELTGAKEYRIARRLLALDINGLQTEYLKRSLKHQENGITSDLRNVIGELRTVLKDTYLPKDYWDGREGKNITPKEDVSWQHQILNGQLLDAIFYEAEPWLNVTGKVAEKEPNIGRQIQLNIERRLEAHAKEKERHNTRAGNADTSEQEGTGKEGSEDSGGTDESGASG